MAGTGITQNLQGIGAYRLEKLLGFNGSFATFEAAGTTGDARAAVVAVQKAFIKDPAAWGAFQREFEGLMKSRANRLCHPMGSGDEAGHYYAAYEWLDGAHLGVRVRDNGPPDAAKAFEWMGGIADALAALHRKGSVHRVISPASIFITESDEARLLHAAWGQLIVASDGGLLNPAWSCILPFIAPEVAAGKRGDEGSDVYTLGANLYFLLSGQPPFWHDDPKTLMEMIAASPIDLTMLESKLPNDAIEVLSELLNHDPEERPVNLPALSDRLMSIGRRISMASRSQEDGGQQAPATQLEMPKQRGVEGIVPESEPPADAVPAAAPAPRRAEPVRAPAAAIPSPAAVTVMDHEVVSKKEQQKRTLILVGASLIVLAGIGILGVYLIGGMMGGGESEDKPKAAAPKKIVINVQPAAASAEKIKNYDATLAHLRSLAQLATAYQRENGTWPAKISDLVPLGAKPEELKDAWEQPIEMRSTYVISSGEDKTWDNDDDVWWDAQQGVRGGYTPERGRLNVAPKTEGAQTPAAQ